MVLGFFRHILQYFSDDGSPSTEAHHRVPKSLQSQPQVAQDGAAFHNGLIPVLEGGRIVAYVQQQGSLLPGSMERSQHNAAHQEHSSKNTVQVVQSQSAHPTSEKKSETANWNYWPDGNFERDFSWDNFEATKNLMTHFATDVGGGDTRGKVDAGEWENGKKATRKCLGIMHCTNHPLCQTLVRPATKGKSRVKQLEEACTSCDAEMVYKSCGVRSTLWKWKGGVHFRNEGTHNHARPPHILHLSTQEQADFNEVVEENPTIGPLGLLVGPRGLTGPGKSVADISDVLLNKDRISKERQRITRGSDGGGDAFVATFAKYVEEHPDFLVFHTFGPITIICLQSQFMVSQLISDEALDEPVNGLVNDAAHGWWKEKNSLLMITSVYCPDLLCWVPGLISYTNGAKTNHFAYHFTVLLERMALEAEQRGIQVRDELFAGVMDFSDAERGGFIDGFVGFWMARNDTRTEDELRVAANTLLRGCREHFRAGVTRLSRAGAIIPADRKDEFVHRATGLLSLQTTEEFLSAARAIVRDFPATASWMEWWNREEHASMLFDSQRRMDINIWSSIPETTNAEEAMHWKLYSACGRDHSFFEGLNALYAMALHYERLLLATQKGIPIRYGQAESWKKVAAQLGRTKRSRDAKKSKGKKNDGRPPDTVKALLSSPTKKQAKLNNAFMTPATPILQTPSKKGKGAKTVKTTPPAPSPAKPSKTSVLPKSHSAGSFPSYRWERNSCWLDTSLELLHVAAMSNFPDFTEIFDFFPDDSPLHAVYKAISDRYDLAADPSVTDMTEKLTSHRNTLREILYNAGAMNTEGDLYSHQGLFTWLTDLVQRCSKKPGDPYRGCAYLERLVLEVHQCSGSDETGGRHLRIWAPAQRQRFQQLSAATYQRYAGHVEDWFADFIKLQREPEPQKQCWNSSCDGNRTDRRGLLLSIPAILLLEVEDAIPLDVESAIGGADSITEVPLWHFPTFLTPLTKTLGKTEGLIYNLVGIAFISGSHTHFVARFRHKDAIYAYDGMDHNGFAIKEVAIKKNATDYASKIAQGPPGFIPWCAVYQLRGGLDAQQKFFEVRKSSIEREYDLSISTHNLNTVPDVSYTGSDLVELEVVNRRTTKEYITPTSPAPDVACSPKLPPTPDFVQTHFEQQAPAASPVSSPANPKSPTPPDSGTDSEFEFDCRCGSSGEGNLLYNPDEGLAIQCGMCAVWSHQACQRSGRAGRLGPKDPFSCDECIRLGQAPKNVMYELQRTMEQKRRELRTRTHRRLTERLLPGRAALAPHGEFWYPVRLIQRDEKEKKWRVRWWRGCVFEQSGVEPGSLSEVNEADLVDSLWGDRKERRKIRLGLWQHASGVPTVEDILSDPSAIPYTTEINTVLSPSTAILRTLLVNPEAVAEGLVPAKDWLVSTKSDLRTTMIQHAGKLSILERAQIANWFETHITQDPSLRHQWVGYLPLAHSFTLVLAFRMKTSSSKMEKLMESEIVELAWDLQSVQRKNALRDEIDVEKEAVLQLEEEMFERSQLAGPAGNYQWGLDAGDHQDDHDPWNDTPASWNHGDRHNSEGELELGPDYVKIIHPPSKKAKAKPKPKPKPKPQPKPKKKQPASKKITATIA